MNSLWLYWVPALGWSHLPRGRQEKNESTVDNCRQELFKKEKKTIAGKCVKVAWPHAVMLLWMLLGLSSLSSCFSTNQNLGSFFFQSICDWPKNRCFWLMGLSRWAGERDTPPVHTYICVPWGIFRFLVRLRGKRASDLTICPLASGILMALRPCLDPTFFRSPYHIKRNLTIFIK